MKRRYKKGDIICQTDIYTFGKHVFYYEIVDDKPNFEFDVLDAYIKNRRNKLYQVRVIYDSIKENEPKLHRITDWAIGYKISKETELLSRTWKKISRDKVMVELL